MNARLLTVNFHLSGCRSLKEKRHRLKRLQDRFGRAPNVAVCESDYQEAHQRAQWSFIATAASGSVAEKALAEILQNLELSVDAEVISAKQETLLP